MNTYLLRISLILLLCLAAASCRHDKAYRIGVSQCSADDWRMLMNEQIEREIMFHPEATVEILSADDDSQKQVEQIRYFMDNDFDIIIVAPNEADELTPVITEAYESGIPVLVFDRSVHGTRFTAFQGADNAAIGEQAALYAARLLPQGGKVLELTGLPGSTPADERARGFRMGIDSIGRKLEIVGSAPADWNYDDALRAADSLLSLYPDAALIYAHNDRMAIGASDMAAKKGLHPYIIGIDAAPTIGMQAVADGKIDATFLYPTEGEELVKTALAILNGEDFQREFLIPASPAVDKSNVGLLLRQNELINEETRQMKLLKKEVDSYWNQHNSQTAVLYGSIIILVLVCIVLFLVLRTFWQHKAHRAQLMEKNRLLEEQRDLEKDLNRQLEAATQSKLMFFTNVSHDLRTPLTLIAEPVEQMARAANLTDEQHLLMKIADKNVKILRRLINQILDFRKFENDRLSLHLEEASPALFAHEWTEGFQVLARKRHIDYVVKISLPEGFTMAFDVDKTERVVFNLLSNAFKFTPVKGTIRFEACIDHDSLKITVFDTGKGISAENLKNIFSRFYQVEKVRPEGSGIGLSLAKAFVELQDGTITAESEPEKGTTFTVTLPVRHVDNAVSENAVKDSRAAAKEVAALLDDIEGPAAEADPADEGKPILLIIDDNEDIRMMVKELLKADYKVIGASGGREGIRKASKYVPDAIICDVMMPEMDGMETCSALKSELSTSHIPVLMLTACSMDEQRVEGYESGADGYMSKPFNSEVLKARVGSLIKNRKMIEEKLCGPVGLVAKNPERAKAPSGDIDNEFYSKLVAIINEEMGNMDLNVDSLADKMGIGRSQFYRKIKALTNLSPVELLRDMRLKRARDLLLSTDKTVSEIAYEVGFSTPAYFTKCYRESFSETPTALRDRIKGDNP